jgi:FixJ family two-component response regulator
MKELNPTVFIVHNDPEVVRGLRALMESVRLSVETYAGARVLLQGLDVSRPGCLVLDVRMPEMNGIELCRRLREAGSIWPAIFVTEHGDVPTAVRAMQEGAFDFLLHPFSEQYLLDRVQAAIEKDCCERRGAAAQQAVADRFAALSPKERQVMNLIVDGLTSKAIARELGIGIKTVDFHKSNIMRKVGVETVVELVYLFIKGGCDRGLWDQSTWGKWAKPGDDAGGAQGGCVHRAAPCHGGVTLEGCGPEAAANAGLGRSDGLHRRTETAPRTARVEGA